MRSETEAGGEGGGLFAEKPRDRAPAAVLPWVIAGGVLVLAALIAIFAGHRGAVVHGVLPLDPQASSLVFSGLTMSESTSLAGGKSTYVDGTVRNQGSHTIQAIEVQALFGNDEGMPPQVETLPLALIRTREPYVDTQPVSAAPLAPDAEREFRLIFENIRPNWNQRPPEIHVVRIADR